MNKIFKVVWSKTKECYVVVSEVAKNNGGKKKVLASVLATLAIMGAGVQVQAADMNTDTSANTAKQINIWATTDKKDNPAAGGTGASGSGVANANDVAPSTFGTEIGIAIGSQNKIKPSITTNAGGGSTITMGIKNEAYGNRNVAIGSNNKTYGEDTIAVGSKLEAGTGHAIVIGNESTSGGRTLAYASASPDATGKVGNAFALAIGTGAQVDGRANNASGGIAIGQDVKATNTNSVVIGHNATASGRQAYAFGNSSGASGSGSIAFGQATEATEHGSVAMGNGAKSKGVGSTSVGRTAKANANGAVALGFNAEATDDGAIAIGGDGKGGATTGPNAYPGEYVGLNEKTTATAKNAVAVVHQATANIAVGVALGSNSVTTTAAGIQGYNPADSRTNKYSDQAGAIGTSTLAAVSIGNGTTATRQITGLAAGTDDTDAVNVAQLKNVNLKYAGDTGNSDVLLKDGTLKVKGDNNFISTSADGTGITVTAKIGNPITANTAGKAEAPATNGLATTTNVADAINASGWNVVSSNNGGSVTGTQATKLVNPGNTVTLSAGKNIVLDQNDKKFTYSLNKDVDLSNAGSLTIGDTKINNAGMTITGGPSITKTGIDAGSKKITNVTAGTADTDAVNVKQLKDTEKHIKPGTYAVANDGSVTLKYVDGNGTEQTETAKITGIAKKSKVINGKNTTVEEGTDTTDNSVTYKVNVKGDLADISSITNGTGSGKISFEGDQVVKVGGDHPISFDGKDGYVTGLENKTWDLKNPTVVSGRAATEDQLKKVSDGFNNTVKLTGNSGATGTQKLNQDNGLSFGVVGADNGKYITTTASGSNVVADLSTDAKAKLNSKVVVAGSGAATVATPTVTTNPDGSTVTTYTVHVDPATATAASTESVVKKAVTGDTNIADISVADGKATGDVGAKYEVSVSRNAVKDAAREAVTVNNGGTKSGTTYTPNADNPITVTPKEDAANHNTTYEVTFDGNKAAKQIPLTYKATNNGTTTADQTVKLDKGLNFTGGDYTTASVGADGKVTFDVNLGTAPTVTDGKPGVPGQAGATGKDGIATVKTVVDTINNSGWKANAKANGGNLDGSATATVVKPGNTVNYAAGKNLIVKQELETDGAGALTGNQTYTYSLNKDIDVESVHVGKDGKDGKIGIDGKNGVDGLDGTNRVDIHVEKGAKGVDGTDGHDGVNGHNGKDGMTRIVYEDKGGKQEVATLNDGLNFTGNNESKTNVQKLNSKVKVQGEGVTENTTSHKLEVNGEEFKSATGNIAVVADGHDTLTVKLNEKLKGLDSVQTKTVELGDHTTPGGTTNITYNSGDKRIEYTTPGTTDTKKVATTDDIWTIQGNGTDVKPVNGKVNVKAGENVVITTPTTADGSMTINAVSPVVYTTPAGDKLTKKSDGKFYKADGSEYTDGDIIASFENPNANSIPAGKLNTTDGGMIVNNIGSAIKTQNPTMPAGQTATYLDKLKAAADDTKTQNAAVNVSDLHNTAEALKANELHIRPTASNRAGETVNKNAAGTADEIYKYDATTKSVTLKYNDGTGAGVTGTEAKIDLSDLANQITSGYTFKTNATENGGKVVNDAATPAAETAVANGGVVNYAAGKNLTVKQDIEKDGTGAATGKQTYTYALADEIGIGEKGQPGVAGKDGVDGKIGVNGKDGSSVVINGKDGSIGMTGPQGQNGKDGINGRDGANISMTSAKGEQVLVNRDPVHSADTDKAERIVYVPKDANGDPIKGADGKNIVREVATMDDGLKFTGNNTVIENKQKLGSLVKVQGEGTQEGTTVINPTTGEKELVLSDGTTKFESAKDNIAVVADGTNTLTVKLNKNLKGLDSVQTKTVELGDRTTPGGTTNITYNSGDKRIEYTTPGTTAGTPETKKVATTDDLWTIQGNGTDVAPVNGKVNVKAGENILITTPATADGSMTINAVTPAVYTDKDGNKLTKDKDGKFHKDDGTEVAAADVITSIQDAAGHTTGGNSIVNNVGSAINNHATPGVTSPTYLDKLDAAAGDTKTQNAAVNVTDLKNTADGLTDKGLKFDANEGGLKTNKLGSTVTVQGSGALTAGKAYADEYNTDNIRTNISQSNGDTVINVGLAKALKDINSISNGNSSITLNSNPGGTNNTPAVQITGGNLSMGNGTANNKIVNLAPGTADTDAVNVKQLKDTELHITPGTYTPGTDKKVKLTYTDGNGGVVSGKEAVIDLSGLSTGGTTASSWNVKSSANTTDGGAVADTHDANAQNIANGKTVEFQSGKNLVVKQTNDATGGNATVEFSLSDNIVAGKDGANGKDGSVGATGKDGSSVVINGADGSIGMTGPKGQNGKDGINGRDGANISMTSSKGEQVLVNRDPAHSADTDKAERIVYVPKDASGNPIQDANGKNIVREVATMDDGLKFTGNNESTVNKHKLGSLVKVQGEGVAENTTLNKVVVGDKNSTEEFESAAGNIAVVADDHDTLTVKLNKNLKGLNSVQTNEIRLVDPTDNSETSIKKDGDRITYTTPGATPGSTVTHKVANLDDEMHIKDTEYTVGSDKKVRLTYVDGNGNPVDNKTAVIDLSGLPVGDKDTDMRIAEGTYTAKNGTVTLKTVNKDGTAANKDVVIKGINTDQYKAGDNVTFTQDGTDANGNPIYKINADLSGASSTESVVKKSLTGDTNIAEISVADGKNTGDKNAKYEVSVSKNAVKDAAREAVEVTGSGVIKVNADNTTTPHKTTYDVAYDPDKAAEVTKISYKSSTSPDAGSQGPKKVSLKDGFDFKSTGGNVKITTDNAGGIDFNVDLSGIHGVSQNIAVGGNVDPTSLTGTDTVTKGTRFDAGNNLVVKRTALNDTGLDHAISYELNKDLQGINSIRNANNGPVMNFNAGDIAISGGNLSMGDGTHNNKIVNVAPGTDKSDVATVGQLTKVISSNGTVTIAPVYKDQDGAPVYDLSVTGVPGADPRVDQLAEEIGRVGAQGAALSALKPIQYDPLEPTQIMAGYGNYRGNSAVALGVAHYKNESTLIHGGVSWAGGSSHMMANAGVTWKVGNRDSEAAVADRYRKGPISSAYAMQQEMAAMKAQNAGLKGEVSDLKAENEQMKAQIAAMMAKLGL